MNGTQLPSFQQTSPTLDGRRARSDQAVISAWLAEQLTSPETIRRAPVSRPRELRRRGGAHGATAGRRGDCRGAAVPSTALQLAGGTPN